MNDLQIFRSEEFGEIRTMLIEEEPWFVGKDIATVLGYKETANMRKLIDESDYCNINPQNVENTGFVQNGRLEPNPNIKRMLLINESGLYQAIFNSTLPNAKKFKRWVTSDVLPTIRKHGAYITPTKTEDILNNPDVMIELLQELKKEREKKAQLELLNLEKDKKIEELQPKADYTEIILKSKSLLTVTQIAKDYGMAGKTLNKILNELKVQYKQSGQWLLYAKYQDEGYVFSETITIGENGKSKMQTKWTQKGRLFLYELLKEKGILPTIERI